MDTQTIVGLSEDTAICMLVDNDICYRIVRRDGSPYVCTRDYIPSRVNLSIVDGVVTNVVRG